MKIAVVFSKSVQGIEIMHQKISSIKLLFLFKANKSTPNKPVQQTNRQYYSEEHSHSN